MQSGLGRVGDRPDSDGGPTSAQVSTQGDNFVGLSLVQANDYLVQLLKQKRWFL